MCKKSGFTLIEMMVVIAIIAISSAAIVPNFIGWRNNAILSQGARQVYSDLQKARTLAIKGNTMMRVNFSTGTNSYTLNGQQRTLEGVVFSAVNFTESGNVAIFNNLGFARNLQDLINNGTVTLRLGSGGGRVSNIVVDATGNIRVQ